MEQPSKTEYDMMMNPILEKYKEVAQPVYNLIQTY